VHPPAAVVGEQGGGHLRAARVVHADEQHLRHRLTGRTRGLGECGEAFGSEPAGEGDQVGVDAGGAPQRGVGLEDDPFDGLLGDDPAVLDREPLRSPGEQRLRHQQFRCAGRFGGGVHFRVLPFVRSRPAEVATGW